MKRIEGASDGQNDHMELGVVVALHISMLKSCLWLEETNQLVNAQNNKAEASDWGNFEKRKMQLIVGGMLRNNSRETGVVWYLSSNSLPQTQVPRMSDFLGCKPALQTRPYRLDPLDYTRLVGSYGHLHRLSLAVLNPCRLDSTNYLL